MTLSLGTVVLSPARLQTAAPAAGLGRSLAILVGPEEASLAFPSQTAREGPGLLCNFNRKDSVVPEERERFSWETAPPAASQSGRPHVSYMGVKPWPGAGLPLDMRRERMTAA